MMSLQGLSRVWIPRPPAGSARLDLNSASEADLTSLPGISVRKARQIIDHRPYTSTA